MIKKSEFLSQHARPVAPAITLRVAMYSSPLRAICRPTGVGQHIVRMAEQLAENDGVSLSLIATRADYAQARPHLSKRLGTVPVHYLPSAERLLRAALIATSLIAIDRWSGNVDWIYSPKEQPVATRRARLAVTVHDVLPFEQNVPGMPRPISRSTVMRWTFLMRRILERAQLIATVSEFTRQRLIELLHVHDENRIVVIGNGVGSTYFLPRRSDDQEVLERHKLEPERYLMSVGSLTYRKGGDLILELAKRIREQRLPWQVVVTGRRHDAELLKRYNSIRAETPDLALHLTGYISDREQAVLLRNAMALVFPSRYEGFGIPVLEAMAAGTPVICRRTAALPEIAGDAAVFVDSEDVAAWLNQVQAIADSSCERSRLVEAGRDRASTFSWERCAARLVTAMIERS